MDTQKIHFYFFNNMIKDVPEKQAYFPNELLFPLAEARTLAIKEMRACTSLDPGPAPPPPILPFADEAGEKVADQSAPMPSLPQHQVLCPVHHSPATWCMLYLTRNLRQAPGRWSRSQVARLPVVDCCAITKKFHQQVLIGIRCH